MSVSGNTSSALSVITNPGSQQLQQRIAAKVVMDQMESEAAMVTKLVQSSDDVADSADVGSHVDFRA
jgi:hypothetical protein